MLLAYGNRAANAAVTCVTVLLSMRRLDFCTLPWSARLREASGYNEKTFLDAAGAPHTDELRTVERIRRIGPTELEDVVAIHDPMYYTRDWQARFIYKLRNDVWLEDYVCGEPHRDPSLVAGVRRP